MKETDWYHGDQKPVRDGVYKRLIPICGLIAYSRWHRGRWALLADSAYLAAVNSAPSEHQDNLLWCGLTEEAK